MWLRCVSCLGDTTAQTASKTIQPGRLYAREDGGGSRRAEGALYLAAVWLRSKGAKVTPRCGTEERFSSFALRLFVSLTLRLFVFLSLSPFVSPLKFI